MSMSCRPDIQALLSAQLRDAGAAWSCGGFGAIAEFHRDPDEPVRLAEGTALVAATPRGALRIEAVPALRPVAYEAASRHAESWEQGVALCLPRAAALMARRTMVTELGPDRDAVRPVDRDAVLFDLGLGVLQADFCVRTRDAETLAVLRAACGAPLLAPGSAVAPRLVALSPHRVVRCRIGRIEVYRPIPPPGATTPDGPHTHLLPKLLRQTRPHAATVPIPAGWLAGMTLFPPHPLGAAAGADVAFDRARHAAFQAILARFGDPEQRAGKAAAASGAADDRHLTTRAARMGFRVALRQREQVRRDRATDRVG